MLTNEIKDLINSLFESTPDYVGVGLGYKQKDGIITNQESIIFFVPQKKPLYSLPSNEVLPNTEYIINNKVLKTDVIEVGEVKPIVCNSACYSWQTIPPQNRQYARPVMGGMSLTSKTKLGTVGTLGLIAVDTETQALVGVTNNHVVIRDAFYSNQRNPSGVIENEYDINDGGGYEPDTVYQPGENPTPPSSYEVGNVIRYVPIYTASEPGITKVDGALVSIECDAIDYNESYKQLNLPFSTPMEFATTSEIDGLLVSNPNLYSTGRTTGAKGGATCPLRIFSIGVNIPVTPYKLQGVNEVVNFTDVLQFVRPENDPSLSTICIYPIYPGDSGSALVADFSGTPKIIGLVFAGSDYYGYACRIDHVSNELGIEAWLGGVKPTVDNSTIQMITVNGLNDDKTQVCDTKTYWQVGITNQINNCGS
jgi:hypothetical protein